MLGREDCITVAELKALKEAPFLLDVRTQTEREQGHIGGEWIPLDQIPGRVDELPTDQLLVVYCHSGHRSQKVVDYLRDLGFLEAKNLLGGIVAYEKDQG